jgi:hypothetical protein
MDATPATGYGFTTGDAAFTGGFFEWPFWIAVCLGVVLWLVLARSSLVHGGDMERSDRVPQLYGYTVCLIAIVVMLVNVGSIVNRSFTLANPLMSSGSPFGWGDVRYSSFEAYKASVSYNPGPIPAGASTAPKLTDAELRTQFEALRADQIARNQIDARRELTESILMLLLSAALFAWHWRWVRRERAP